MKKTFFLVFAISILFCFSTTSFAAVHSHDNLTVMNVDINGVTPEVYAFFERWSKAPNTKRILTMACTSPFDGSQTMTPLFYLIDEPVSGSIEFSLSPLRFDTPYFPKNPISGFSFESVTGANNFTHAQMASNSTFSFTVPSARTVNKRDTKTTFHSFAVYFSSVSSPFTITDNGVNYDWRSDTPLTVNFFSGSTPIFKEPPPIPPSSSSEPPPPPVFPDIDIPSGPPSFPDIEIPDVDRPVIVPPYDDTYIWYDPNAWEDFFNDINFNIGKIVTMSIIILCLIFSIILILKVIKYFLRGDDIFKDWRL